MDGTIAPSSPAPRSRALATALLALTWMSRKLVAAYERSRASRAFSSFSSTRAPSSPTPAPAVAAGAGEQAEPAAPGLPSWPLCFRLPCRGLSESSSAAFSAVGPGSARAPLSCAEPPSKWALPALRPDASSGSASLSLAKVAPAAALPATWAHSPAASRQRCHVLAHSPVPAVPCAETRLSCGGQSAPS